MSTKTAEHKEKPVSDLESLEKITLKERKNVLLLGSKISKNKRWLKTFAQCCISASVSKQWTYFNGCAPLKLPLPVWTKTTLPPDALQQRPVATPLGQWPFHTASGQSGSPGSPRSNVHPHHRHNSSLAGFPGTCWCLLAGAGAPQYPESERSPQCSGRRPRPH